MPEAIGLPRCLASVEGTQCETEWVASVSDEIRVEFEHSLRECHRLVFQVAYAVLRDRADAEEIVQDVFFRAYRKLSGLREPHKFRAWVARMSYRLALNHCRAATRARLRDTSWLQMTAPAASVESIVSQREFQHRLRQEIDRLPEKLRAVLLLSAIDELDTCDVASALHIPEGTVRSRLHLARKALLRVFSDETL